MSSNNDQNVNEKNLLSKAREYIHEAVKTDEQREAEKSTLEKMKESVPSSASEAVEKAKETINTGIASTKKGFEERLNENSAGEPIRKLSEEAKPGLIEKTKQATVHSVTGLREKIYDVTKSKEEKEAEEFAAKPFTEKVSETVESQLQEAKEAMHLPESDKTD